MDAWVAIAVGSDDDWRALTRAWAGRPGVLRPAFSTLSGACNITTSWTGILPSGPSQRGRLRRDARPASRRCVPAGVVVNAEQLVHDPHLRERDFFWDIDHPEAGMRRYAGQPVRLSATPARLYARRLAWASTTRQVLGGLLGLSADERAALRDRGGDWRPPVAAVIWRVSPRMR